MSLLKADRRFLNILEITPEILKAEGVKAVFLDADNTLALHDSQTPFEGVSEWLQKTRAAGIPLIIISNNSEERVAPFAEKLGLPFVPKSAKPLSKGFKLASEKFGIKPCEAAVVGDQVFTDVLGGKLFGAKVFLTEPLGPDTDKFIKAKRRLEKYFR